MLLECLNDFHATVLPGFDSRPELPSPKRHFFSTALELRENEIRQGRKMILKSIRACYCGIDAPSHSNTVVSFRSGNADIYYLIKEPTRRKPF